LILAHDNRIEIEAGNYRVVDVRAFVKHLDDEGKVTGDQLFSEPQFERDAKGTYVKVKPGNPGKSRITLGLTFDDGGYENESVDANVVYPNNPPDKFYMIEPWMAADHGLSGTIYMDLGPQHNHAAVSAVVVYGASEPTPIPAKDVEFHVIGPNPSSAPFSLNPENGSLKAIKFGHALVMTSFRGKSTLTCVAVTGNVEEGGARTECSELVPPGMNPPPSDVIDPSTAPSVKPRPQ
jgi:hypothetical protein